MALRGCSNGKLIPWGNSWNFSATTKFICRDRWPLYQPKKLVTFFTNLSCRDLIYIMPESGNHINQRPIVCIQTNLKLPHAGLINNTYSRSIYPLPVWVSTNSLSIILYQWISHYRKVVYWWDLKNKNTYLHTSFVVYCITRCVVILSTIE